MNQSNFEAKFLKPIDKVFVFLGAYFEKLCGIILKHSYTKCHKERTKLLKENTLLIKNINN
jgi:hypothetical protein